MKSTPANNLYEILIKIDETNDLLKEQIGLMRNIINEQQATRKHLAQLKHLHKTNTYYTIPDNNHNYRYETYQNLIRETDAING